MENPLSIPMTCLSSECGKFERQVQPYLCLPSDDMNKCYGGNVAILDYSWGLHCFFPFYRFPGLHLQVAQSDIMIHSIKMDLCCLITSMQPWSHWKWPGKLTDWKAEIPGQTFCPSVETDKCVLLSTLNWSVSSSCFAAVLTLFLLTLCLAVIFAIVSHFLTHLRRFPLTTKSLGE